MKLVGNETFFYFILLENKKVVFYFRELLYINVEKYLIYKVLIPCYDEAAQIQF